MKALEFIWEIPAYTNEAWASQVKNPQDVMARARPLIEGLGGKIDTVYYAFGDYDLVGVMEMPDNVSAAAASLAISASGAARTVKLTPLMTVEEGIDAMKRAGGSGYQPPSA